MKLPRYAATASCVCELLIGSIGDASSQTGPRCSIIPMPVCSTNPRSRPIPSGMLGKRMVMADCASALPEALASLYSYDDPACHPAEQAVSPDPKFVQDATSSLPEEFKDFKELAAR